MIWTLLSERIRRDLGRLLKFDPFLAQSPFFLPKYPRAEEGGCGHNLRPSHPPYKVFVRVITDHLHAQGLDILADMPSPESH